MSQQKQQKPQPDSNALGWGAADMTHMFTVALARLLGGAVDLQPRTMKAKSEPGARRIRDDDD